MRRHLNLIIFATLIVSLAACNSKPTVTQEQSKAESLLNAASELTVCHDPTLP